MCSKANQEQKLSSLWCLYPCCPVVIPKLMSYTLGFYYKTTLLTGTFFLMFTGCNFFTTLDFQIQWLKENRC